MPVTDGHLAAVFVAFERKASKEELIALWRGFVGKPQTLSLPSAPSPFLTYFEDDARPQTRLDRDAALVVPRHIVLEEVSWAGRRMGASSGEVMGERRWAKILVATAGSEMYATMVRGPSQPPSLPSWRRGHPPRPESFVQPSRPPSRSPRSRHRLAVSSRLRRWVTPLMMISGGDGLWTPGRCFPP